MFCFVLFCFVLFFFFFHFSRTMQLLTSKTHQPRRTVDGLVTRPIRLKSNSFLYLSIYMDDFYSSVQLILYGQMEHFYENNFPWLFKVLFLNFIYGDIYYSVPPASQPPEYL